MVTFRNNNGRRNNHRRVDRNYKSNVDRNKFSNSFNNENFQRKNAGRNNHNASKLVEKYTDLAREALSNGDKILSENYFQHADHFMRIINEREDLRRSNKAPNSDEEIKGDKENIKEVQNKQESHKSTENLNQLNVIADN